MDTIFVKIKVNELPILTLTPKADTIEEGQSAIIKISGAKSYVWTPNTWIQLSDDSIIASPPITTNYKVTGTDTNQCSQTDYVLITVNKKSTEGITSSLQSGFNLYPNPISNYIMIESPVNAELTIYTISGKEVLKTKTFEKMTRLNTSSFGSGVYIFSLKTEGSSRYFRVEKE